MPRKKRETGQAPFEKPFFLLNGGLNTEVSPLNAPEATTVDELNMEIMRDGSRRRRRGIRQEIGGIPYSQSEAEVIDDLGVFSRANVYQWDSPGGDTSRTIQVVKIGGTLHFYNDDEILSANKLDYTLSLMDWATTDIQQDVIGSAVTFTSHQGVLFISGRYVTPIYVELLVESGLETLVTTPITIRVRDFAGIRDEVPSNIKPTVLTESHEYNLINRGWKPGSADPTGEGYLKFFDDTGYYPAKNMIPWKGYSKKAEAGYNISNSSYNPADWTKTYSSAKIEAEIFGEADAPQGHVLLDPFNTTYGQVGSGTGAQNVSLVSDFNPLPSGGSTYIEMQLHVPASHLLSVGDPVELVGGYITWYYQHLGIGPPTIRKGGDIPISGTYPALAGTAGLIVVIRIPVPYDVYKRSNDYAHLITWTGPTTLGTLQLPNVIGGVETDRRPTAIAMFAGRIWYAGIDSGRFSDTVLFSQIVLNSETDYDKYGKCYQAGDPTDEFRSLVVPSDGGTIQVPGLAGVKAMLPLQNSILLFASSGVYEISGGREPFSANNFTVRRLSAVEAYSAIGMTNTDFGALYTSPRGIYSIVPSDITGMLISQPIIDDNLKTLWNSIPDENQKLAQLSYDYALQKVYLLYSEVTRDRDHFTHALVYDLRNKGWYKLSLPYPEPQGYGHRIRCAVITKAGDGSNANKKVKFMSTFLSIDTAPQVYVLDMDQTLYEDADFRQPLPYMITAYDGIGGAEVPKDFAHKRQAPVMHVYAKRTETGVDGNGLPVNTSSIIVEPRWDFTDTNSTGRAGSPQQAYRSRTLYLGNPTEDGQPVVISRLKLRGRGKSLHLKFSGEADKDMHILGYAIFYKIGRYA